MYTREQASQIRQVFWTRFGKYMSPVLSADGENINWINYKTGIRSVSFKMNATKDDAIIAIEIQHKNLEHALKLYEQFVFLQPFLEEVLGEKWEWEPIAANDQYQQLSRISAVYKPCNIFKESDWPIIISFLKPRIIAIDRFWCEHKMIFELIG